MSDVIISVENLGKKYAIRHEADRARYKTLRETVVKSAAGLFRRRNGQERARNEEFWALHNVSFDVERGKVLGIIGRNGAGKSTLLKILSRITEPSEGRVTLRGRVASLLEVGTGFHPELTGRENIFLNGSILGMSHAEIRRKFDEIVDFAGVEKFLDTPVKRYSSGMYVRLAFAVAAHLEPEILIVDEVLSVGDAEFQKRCVGKMHDVAKKEGRTVLVVSHNLPTVRDLCSSGLLLREGRLTENGPIAEVIASYLVSGQQDSGCWKPVRRTLNGDFRFDEISLADGSGAVKADFDFTESVHLKILGTAARRLENAQIAVRVTSQEGIVVFTTCSTDASRLLHPIAAGQIGWHITLAPHFLAPGRYSVTVAAHIPRVQLFDVMNDELSFSVNADSYFPDGRIGLVIPPIAWEMNGVGE